MLSQIVHVLISVTAVAAVFEFAPAIVHAKTDVERLRLLAGAILFVAVAAGSLARREEPLNYRNALILAAQVVWLISAYKSRQQRRLGSSK